MRCNYRIIIYFLKNFLLTKNAAESAAEQEVRNNKLFYAGLKHLNKVPANVEFDDCRNCSFSVAIFSVGNKTYEVCNYLGLKDKGSS